MFEHPLPHDIQLVLKLLGHIGMTTVIQQDDAVSEIIQTFVCDLGTQLLKLLTVMVCIDSAVL
jgi:hypothetical protein